MHNLRQYNLYPIKVTEIIMFNRTFDPLHLTRSYQNVLRKLKRD